MLDLARQWRATRTSREQREEARQLLSEVEAALSGEQAQEALSMAERLHAVSQNSARLHVHAHWVNAKAYWAADRKRQVLVHLYLCLMAPYGTLRRRLDR